MGVVGAAERLAPLLGMTADELVKKLMGTSGYQVIAKGVSPLVWLSLIHI